MERTKELLTFLDSVDEAELWSQMRALIPGIELVDGSRWSSAVPPLADSPMNCTNTIVFLWNRTVCSHLPSKPRGTMYDGPSSGVVIEWSRSTTNDGCLRSGRFAAGYDTSDAPMKAFVDAVFRLVRQATGNRVVRVSGEADRSYRLGAHTRDAAVSDGLRLRDRSVEIYFRPA